MLFSILFLSLVICLCVKNNSWGKLSQLKFLELILSVVPSLIFTAVFNLLSCIFDSLAFILLNSTIIYNYLQYFCCSSVQF